MSYDFLYTVENNIATITLNRPEVLNALTLEICAQLRDLFETLRHDDSVKAVIITGAGRAFCSGDDLDAVTAERYGLVKMGADHRAFYEAFKEKKKPEFSGK